MARKIDTKVPRRLVMAHKPAINLKDELKVATELLKSQRTEDNSDLEYATITTTKIEHTRDVDDEYLREEIIRGQAKQAAFDVLAALRGLNVPTQVPQDYRGQTVKNQTQMDRIRENLKSKKDAIESSEKMKKLRDLKKIGKKIQQEVLHKRSREKKEFLEKVKKRTSDELFE